MKKISSRQLASLLMITSTSVILSACSSSITRFGDTLGLNDEPSYSSPSYNYNRSYRGTRPSNPRKYTNKTYNNNSSQAYNNYTPPRVEQQKLARLHTEQPRNRRLREHDFNSVKSSKRRVFKETQPDYTTSNSNFNADLASDGTIKVRPGDTLYSISRRHNVTMQNLMNSNDLNDSTIHVGQTLRIPGQPSGAYKSVSATYDDVPAPTTRRAAPRSRRGGTSNWVDAIEDNTSAYKPTQVPSSRAPSNRQPAFDGSTYIVQSGDTLYSVARATGVKYTSLASVNNLDENFTIRVGQRLIVPTDDDTSRRVQQPKVAPKKTYQAESQMKTQTTKPEPVQKQTKVAAYTPPKLYKPRLKNAGPLSLRWPVRGRIISTFGKKEDGKNNDGVNLAVPTGTEVVSAEAGVVAYAGSELEGYGKLLLIRHADNWVTAYAHNSTLKVKRGDRVQRGQVIAAAGNSGKVSQPQLHFELRKGSKPVDPMLYMAQK